MSPKKKIKLLKNLAADLHELVVQQEQLRDSTNALCKNIMETLAKRKKSGDKQNDVDKGGEIPVQVRACLTCEEYVEMDKYLEHKEKCFFQLTNIPIQTTSGETSKKVEPMGVTFLPRPSRELPDEIFEPLHGPIETEEIISSGLTTSVTLFDEIESFPEKLEIETSITPPEDWKPAPEPSKEKQDATKGKSVDVFESTPGPSGRKTVVTKTEGLPGPSGINKNITIEIKNSNSSGIAKNIRQATAPGSKKKKTVKVAKILSISAGPSKEICKSTPGPSEIKKSESNHSGVKEIFLPTAGSSGMKKSVTKTEVFDPISGPKKGVLEVTPGSRGTNKRATKPSILKQALVSPGIKEDVAKASTSRNSAKQALEVTPGPSGTNKRATKPSILKQALVSPRIKEDVAKSSTSRNSAKPLEVTPGPSGTNKRARKPTILKEVLEVPSGIKDDVAKASNTSSYTEQVLEVIPGTSGINKKATKPSILKKRLEISPGIKEGVAKASNSTEQVLEVIPGPSGMNKKATKASILKKGLEISPGIKEGVAKAKIEVTPRSSGINKRATTVLKEVPSGIKENVGKASTSRACTEELLEVTPGPSGTNKKATKSSILKQALEVSPGIKERVLKPSTSRKCADQALEVTPRPSGINKRASKPSILKQILEVPPGPGVKLVKRASTCRGFPDLVLETIPEHNGEAKKAKLVPLLPKPCPNRKLSGDIMGPVSGVTVVTPITTVSVLPSSPIVYQCDNCGAFCDAFTVRRHLANCFANTSVAVVEPTVEELNNQKTAEEEEKMQKSKGKKRRKKNKEKNKSTEEKESEMKDESKGSINYAEANSEEIAFQEVGPSPQTLGQYYETVALEIQKDLYEQALLAKGYRLEIMEEGTQTNLETIQEEVLYECETPAIELQYNQDAGASVENVIIGLPQTFYQGTTPPPGSKNTLVHLSIPETNAKRMQVAVPVLQKPKGENEQQVKVMFFDDGQATSGIGATPQHSANVTIQDGSLLPDDQLPEFFTPKEERENPPRQVKYYTLRNGNHLTFIKVVYE